MQTRRKIITLASRGEKVAHFLTLLCVAAFPMALLQMTDYRGVFRERIMGNWVLRARGVCLFLYPRVCNKVGTQT